jgi:hypothetical protein
VGAGKHIPCNAHTFEINRQRALDDLAGLFVRNFETYAAGASAEVKAAAPKT